MPKERTYSWLIATLIILIIFIQVSGHLTLTNGAIEHLFNVLSSRSPANFNISAKYVNLLIQTPFKILKLLGVNEFKYYAYTFSFIFNLIPLLPLAYFLLKRKKDDLAFVIPLIGISLIYALLDLHLFSECIFGISLFSIFMAVIHYSENQMSIFEKMFFVALTPIVSLAGWSFLILAPVLWMFAWLKKTKSNSVFLIVLCAGMIPGIISTIDAINNNHLIRLFFLDSIQGKFNVKNLSFAIGAHLVLFGSLFYHLLTKNDWKALASGLILICFLNWFDWTFATYIYQQFQAGNLVLVTLVIGVVSFLGFLKLKNFSISCFYPLLVLSLLVSIFLQSHRKLKITNSLLKYYDICSNSSNGATVDIVFLDDIFSDISKMPYMSRAACLIRNEKPKSIINMNGKTEAVELISNDALLPNIDVYIKIETSAVKK
jgi:hypothetical protein